MGIQFTNNAFSTLDSGISDVATTITLESGGGAAFPSLGTGDYFYATLAPTVGDKEIVKCTARSGDVLTVTRAQDGTSAQTFAAGTRIELRPIAQAMRDIRDEAESKALALAIALG